MGAGDGVFLPRADVAGGSQPVAAAAAAAAAAPATAAMPPKELGRRVVTQWPPGVRSVVHISPELGFQKSWISFPS